MRLLFSLVLSCLALASWARRPASNCGLSCFRWNKCMGKLDGSHGNRPGQLGDTGIIVLQHCGPLQKKGCDCSLEEDEGESKEIKLSSSSPVSRFSKTKTRTVFKPRTSSHIRTRPTSASATTTTERSALRALFNSRSRIYRSKRLIGGNQRY